MVCAGLALAVDLQIGFPELEIERINGQALLDDFCR
jgi:hypothetical protein